MGKVIVSNDSVPTTDRECSCGEPVAVAAPLGKYYITRGDAARFALCCVFLPGYVLGDIAFHLHQGEDVRGIVSSNAEPRDPANLKMLAALALAGGGIGLALAYGNGGALLDYAVKGIEGAFILPIGTANLWGALAGSVYGAPIAFRAAAQKVLASRPLQALRAASSVPIYTDQPKLQGPK